MSNIIIGTCQVCNKQNVEIIFGICADLSCVVSDEEEPKEEE